MKNRETTEKHQDHGAKHAKRYAERVEDFERLGHLDAFTRRLIWTLAQIELEEERLQMEVTERGAFETILTDKGDERERAAARWNMLKDCRARIQAICGQIERVLRAQRENTEARPDPEVEAFFT